MLEFIAMAVCYAWIASMLVVALLVFRSAGAWRTSFWMTGIGCVLLILGGPFTLTDYIRLQLKGVR